MAKDKDKAKQNGGAAIAPEHAATPEAWHEANSEHDAPDGGLDAATVAGLAAMGPSQDEPGPEDFERHGGARLISDHERDLELLADVERRIKNRGPVIAARALKSGGKNPIVKIGGRVFTPRKRPEKAGGGIGLAEVGERSEASLD